MRILRSFGTTTTSTPLSLPFWPSFHCSKTRVANSSMLSLPDRRHREHDDLVGRLLLVVLERRGRGARALAGDRISASSTTRPDRNGTSAAPRGRRPRTRRTAPRTRAVRARLPPKRSRSRASRPRSARRRTRSPRRARCPWPTSTSADAVEPREHAPRRPARRAASRSSARSTASHSAAVTRLRSPLSAQDDDAPLEQAHDQQHGRPLGCGEELALEELRLSRTG